MINRPYVTLNVAMTVDGKTDTVSPSRCRDLFRVRYGES